ncbi:DUF2637 domain-containing protein [Streptomyces xiangluensis]|uniref:DUF2637 domain-containing protein n=1 Tax=Streptomyces xiangluensis TaxID=2665720 RepID=A0ABV8YVF4_9ACTN
MADPRHIHRGLIATITTGAIIIAGIGFAGSYAAVRELALEQGFGKFSYLFPIGIDAGICVLLALDLLLTWIRIPFPILRQTAWLLTVATIAFNGAAAWPDPLGVGMHAVIPILFVVVVEAARHAIGRIANITADEHMEGVRLTRWLLAPVPTFLLWRRMKLWELRSYDAVIKLEQERLVYQARLRSRYGRGWRRKAPVESLIPLRLARYGIPLADTAPSGLTAAGLEPSPPSAAQQEPAAADTSAAATVAARSRSAGSALAGTATPPTPQPADTQSDHAPGQHEPTNQHSPSHMPDVQPQTPPQLPPSLLDNAQPMPAETSHIGYTETDIPQESPTAHPHLITDNIQTPANPPLSTQRKSQTNAEDNPPPPEEQQKKKENHRIKELTQVDRYYLGWHAFKQQHNREPRPTELSTYLAQEKILDRNQQPVKGKTLARYYLEFRIYTTWAQHRANTPHPDPDLIIKDLTQQGITAQYNKPLNVQDLTQHQHTFERRWHTLTHRAPST